MVDGRYLKLNIIKLSNLRNGSGYYNKIWQNVAQAHHVNLKCTRTYELFKNPSWGRPLLNFLIITSAIFLQITLYITTVFGRMSRIGLL